MTKNRSKYVEINYICQLLKSNNHNHSIYKLFRFLMSDIHIVQKIATNKCQIFHFNELYVLKLENIEHACLKMNFNKYFQAGHDKMKSTRQLINPIAEAA